MQHFTLDDDDSMPELGGMRPDRLVDVRPQERTRRHGGIGYELVLATAVPQLGAQEAECALPAFLQQQEEAKAAEEEEGERLNDKIFARIPLSSRETAVWRRWGRAAATVVLLLWVKEEEKEEEEEKEVAQDLLFLPPPGHYGPG